MKMKTAYILALILILSANAALAQKVVPEKTTKLFDDLTAYINDSKNGCTQTLPSSNTADGWRTWSYHEGALPYQFGPCYAHLRQLFKEASLNYTDDDRNEFRATIILNAYPNLLFSMENDSDVIVNKSITETVGAETNDISQYGASFELGVEFGNTFSQISSTLGINVSKSTTETFTTESSSTISAEIPPRKEFFLYQLGFNVMIIHGESSGGGRGWNIWTESEFVDLAPQFQAHAKSLSLTKSRAAASRM